MSKQSVWKVGDSLAISLPSGWAKQSKIVKGSRVRVFELEDGKLVISPEAIE